jgi:hypothetical protein
MSKDRAAKLARLQEKLEKTDMGSGGSQGFVYIQPDSKVVLRILPDVGDMEFFFQEVGRHYFADDKWVYCPNFTSSGELECPICETRSALWNKGDKVSKELSKQLSLRKYYWMNVIVRGEESDGPKIWTPGVTVIGQIAAVIGDPDYGDIYDEIEGRDITIGRKGSGFDTEYNVLPKPKKSPISDKDEQIDNWLEAARDLTYAELSDDPAEDEELKAGHVLYSYPYSRLQDEFDEFFGLDGDYEEDESEEEYEDEVNEPEDEDEKEVDEIQAELEKRQQRRSSRQAVRRRA